jgi:CheY-like chemotaxis protein
MSKYFTNGTLCLALYYIIGWQRLVMHKNGPIIVIEDDADDQELLNEIFRELKIPNFVRFFNSCMNALDYLLTTIEKPFLIISDINLPAMTGMELCKKITDNESLKVKSIPFVFLTTTSDQKVITEAYKMFVQGFFVKPTSMHELKNMVRMIVDYWNICRNPYSG